MRKTRGPQVGRTLPTKKYCNLIAIGILILSLAFYLYRLDAWFMHDDEGSYCYAAWRISEGELPYRDFLTPQLPLFLYWGGLMVKMFGTSILALRYATVLATLLAAFFVYLVAKDILGCNVALLSLPLFIVHKDVYFIARFFRPEAYMLLFIAIGMYAFVLSHRQNRCWGLLLSGALFGLAMLCKLFGALPFAGCVLFLLYEWLRSRRKGIMTEVAVFTAGFVAIAGTVFVAFQWACPYFLTAVLGHHAMQGAELTHWQVFIKSVSFYWSYFRGNPWFLLLSIPAIARALSAKAQLGTFPLWQIPTAAAFLFLSRGLQDRHLVYLVPALSILAACSLEPLFDQQPATAASISGHRRRGTGSASRWAKAALGLIAIGIALWPSLRNDLQVAAWEEEDTLPLARYIRAHTSESDYVLCDYPGLNFHAERKNTYWGAGLSGGAASSGQITGAALIAEIEDKDVQLVLINTSGSAHQLVDLYDYADFHQYVQSQFHLVRKFDRSYQTFEIYHRDELMPLRPQIDFGAELSLTGADLGAGTLQAGEKLSVALRWQALSEMQRDYTVSLRLIDGEGHLWGQHDKLLEKTFTSGWVEYQEIISRAPTSQWASAEVVLDEYHVPALPGTPPGEYRLAMVLYHLGSGELLQAVDEGGTVVGTQWALGTVQVVRPEEFPSADELAIQAGIPQDLGDDVQLLGYDGIAEKAHPGDSLHLVLFWQALRTVDTDWQLLLRIRGAQGRVLAERKFDIANSHHLPSQWVEDEVVRGQYDLAVDASAPSGEAQLLLNLTDPATGQRLLERDLVISKLNIEGRRREFTMPTTIQNPLRVNLANRVFLLGYDVAQTSIKPGSVLHLTLYWQAQATTKIGYTVFTHLLCKDGQIWGQKDSVPVQGTYPTTGWLPGEIIVDEYEITVRPEAAPGEYVLEIGMYNAITGERLLVLGEKGQELGDGVSLTTVNVSTPVEGN